MSKKSPQLRFKGFTDDWEDRKLGDVLSERNDQTPETNEYPLMSFVQGKGVTPKGERYNRSFLVKDSEKKYKKTELGDFIYSSNNLETGSIGFNRTGKAVISPVYSIFESKKSRESQFIGIMSARKDFISKMVRFRQGVVYGQWRIHESDFLNIDMKMPNDKEQQLIISFFENIDKTIALHQYKLDLLKEQKKGYLQKMFPKNGAKVPELRFEGFADDWEERKFENNIVSIQTGTNLLGTDANEGTPLLKMGNIQRGYFSFNKLEYLDSNSNVESENIVNYGDFLFNTRNTLELVGKGATWTGMSGKYAFNSNIARFKFNGIDTIFFNYLYNTQQVISQVHARAVGTTSVAAVYPRDLNSLLYYLPSIEEQKKIGSFFNQLDNTIALHQRKLDLLREQKKGFLQKMFV